jgi:hypothetical protein
MAPWPSLLAHATAVTGAISACSLIFRRNSDSLLRFVAGLVAICARGTRPRADRALEVLSLTQRSDSASGDDDAKRSSARDRLTLKRQASVRDGSSKRQQPYCPQATVVDQHRPPELR